jgi:predicted DNA-binding transcriptional regulator AlpA
MAVVIKYSSSDGAKLGPIPKKSRGHTRPAPPQFDISGPGRLRVANLLVLFGISHSTLYARMRVGAFPRPDGMDGRIPFWHTSTIRAALVGTAEK